MKFTVDKQEEFVIFKLQEKNINSEIAPKLKSEFIMLISVEGHRNIILDLSEVKYMDSSGISAMLLGDRLCNKFEPRGNFVIANAETFVKDLLNITRLGNVITVVESIEEAVQYIIGVYDEKNDAENNFNDGNKEKDE